MCFGFSSCERCGKTRAEDRGIVGRVSIGYVARVKNMCSRQAFRCRLRAVSYRHVARVSERALDVGGHLVDRWAAILVFASVCLAVRKSPNIAILWNDLTCSDHGDKSRQVAC